MENDINRKLVIPFIICLGFIAVSVNSFFKGIGHHETWRIVLASVGGLFFVVLAGFIVIHVIKTAKLHKRNN